MSAATTSSSLGNPRPVRGGRDASWYGTLGILTACLVLLATVSFGG